MTTLWLHAYFSTFCIQLFSAQLFPPTFYVYGIVFIECFGLLIDFWVAFCFTTKFGSAFFTLPSSLTSFDIFVPKKHKKWQKMRNQVKDHGKIVPKGGMSSKMDPMKEKLFLSLMKVVIIGRDPSTSTWQNNNPINIFFRRRSKNGIYKTFQLI